MPEKDPDKVRGPLSAAEKAQIEQLHAEGRGRNEIARILNRPWSTITMYTRNAGLSFSNPSAMLGVEKRRAEAAARRAALVHDLLDDVDRLRDDLFSEITYLPRFKGDVKHTLPEPVPQDKANIARAASLLLDRSIKLDQYDREAASGAAKGLLGKLADIVREAATPRDKMPRDPDDDPLGEDEDESGDRDPDDEDLR